MYCPFCSAEKTQVLDSRLVREGNKVRRRRECKTCGQRFTTREVCERRFPCVIKSDDREEIFDEAKLRNGILLAIGKDKETLVQRAVETVEAALPRRRAVSSSQIGYQVAAALRGIDHAAYVRFTSVWQDFDDARAFSDAARGLEGEMSPELRHRQIDMLADGQNEG